jgi:hypothetical protein
MASTSTLGSAAPDPMRMRRPGGMARAAASGVVIFVLQRSLDGVIAPVTMESFPRRLNALLLVP